MPIKVGVTGGIGSGKSKVCSILEEMGYPVYYSDIASKHIVNTNKHIRTQLIELLGPEVYIGNELNKTFLATKLFNNDEIRESVNQIIHPIVREEFQKWVNTKEATIVFNEAAILIETGSYKLLDYIVLVIAPEELRIQRIMNRDSISKEDVLLRMEKQWSDEEKQKFADYIIHNDGTPLKEQIDSLIASIKNR